MKVRDVTLDMPFRFVGSGKIYIARGNGWYNTPEGYSGGPWHDDEQEVEEVKTNLHSHSFDDMRDSEVTNSYVNLVRGPSFDKWTDGDRALARYALTVRGLDPHQISR